MDHNPSQSSSPAGAPDAVGPVLDPLQCQTPQHPNPPQPSSKFSSNTDPGTRARRYQWLWRRPLLALRLKRRVLLAAGDADVVPLGPTWSVGRLSSGLTYYLCANRKPVQQLHLRLVVRTGSCHEADDQQACLCWCNVACLGCLWSRVDRGSSRSSQC